MKTPYFLATLAVSSIVLTACTTPTPSTITQTTQQTLQVEPQQQQTASVTISPATTMETTQQTTQQSTQAQTQTKAKLTIEDYKQWMLSPEIISENIADWSQMNKDQQDCYGVMNGNTDGGDLLSTLIADDTTRAQLRLSVYTPEYVMALENKIVALTHEQDNADFYATSVCHLGNGVDVATGFAWPQGQKTITAADDEETYKTNLIKGLPNTPDPSKGALIIANNDDIHEYNDIQRYNNTATGAEVYPCSGIIKGTNLLWDCFQGLAHDDKDDITGSSMEEWTIPLDGKKITTRKYTED